MSARAIATVLVLVSLAACSSVTGSSFETLGVPHVSPPPGKAALVIGWEQEEREGWTVARLKVDGRTLDEWNAATQRPAVVYLEPGERAVQLLAYQNKAPGGRVVRRYRSPTVEVVLGAAGRSICAVKVRGTRRRRPRLRCWSGEGQERRAGVAGEGASATLAKRGVIQPTQSGGLIESPYPRSNTGPEAQESQPLVPTPYASATPPAPQPPPERPDLTTSPYEDQSGVAERVRELEERLESLERSMQKLVDERTKQRSGAR